MRQGFLGLVLVLFTTSVQAECDKKYHFDVKEGRLETPKYEELGVEGAKALADFIIKNKPKIRLLRLNRDALGNEGTIILAKALPVLKDSLQYLGMDDNEIGDAGMKALAEALKSMSKLRIAFFNINLVTDEGAKALHCLSSLKELRGISLAYNNLTEKGKTDLQKRLERVTVMFG